MTQGGSLVSVELGTLWKVGPHTAGPAGPHTDGFLLLVL